MRINDGPNFLKFGFSESFENGSAENCWKNCCRKGFILPGKLGSSDILSKAVALSTEPERNTVFVEGADGKAAVQEVKTSTSPRESAEVDEEPVAMKEGSKEPSEKADKDSAQVQQKQTDDKKQAEEYPQAKVSTKVEEDVDADEKNTVVREEKTWLEGVKNWFW